VTAAISTPTAAHCKRSASPANGACVVGRASQGSKLDLASGGCAAARGHASGASARVLGRALRATSRLWVLTAWLASAALPFVSQRARADATLVPGEVLVVLGSMQAAEGPGDPSLDKVEALRKPPFDSFPKKTLLRRVEVKLELGKESEVELPNGRRLRLSLIEKLKDGRFRVSISINKPGQRDYLPVMTVAAAPGDPFFVAGQKHEGGTLIVGVRIGAAKL
jgi:hypothetical protein